MESHTPSIIVNDKEKFHKIQAEHAKLPQEDCPLIHRFVPGMYIREIFMKKGLTVTSALHLTEHPFVISQGSVLVWKPGEEPVRLQAPYCGITKAGTQRLIFVEENTQWLTFHCNPDNETDIQKLEDRYVDRKSNPFMDIELNQDLPKALSGDQPK